MKLYKVLNGTKTKDGGNFDYKEYLPKDKKPGKWTPKIKDISCCERGYHLTQDYMKWLNGGTVVYEAEGRGEHIKDNNKICFSQIRLVKKIETNTGKGNVGLCNSGNCNTGNWNSGDRNTGNCNTSNWNSGNRNSGNRNSGDRNSGNWNTGDWNTGDWNTGNCNTGSWNSGDRNTGNRNSGDRNSGYRNSGSWNSGDRNTGYFNTLFPQIRIFNKLTKKTDIQFPSWLYFDLCVWVAVEDMNESEKQEFWWYKTTDGYLRSATYKEAFKSAFENASTEGVKQLLELPNFSYAVFEDISGITKKMIQEKIQ